MNGNLFYVVLLVIFAALLSLGQSAVTIESSKVSDLFDDDDLLWDRSLQDREPEPSPRDNRYCDYPVALSIGENNFDTSNSVDQVSNHGTCGSLSFNAWYSYSVPAGGRGQFSIQAPGMMIGVYEACGSTAIVCGSGSVALEKESLTSNDLYIVLSSSSNTAGSVQLLNVVSVVSSATVITIHIAAGTYSQAQLSSAIGSLLGLPASEWYRIQVVQDSAKRDSAINFFIGASAYPGAPSAASLTANFMVAISGNAAALGSSFTVTSFTSAVQNVSQPTYSISYVSADPICNSDADCHWNGGCVEFGCSCYSGYGDSDAGLSCATLPDASCLAQYQAVDAGSSAFTPTYSVDVVGGDFVMMVNSSLQATNFVYNNGSNITQDANSVGFSTDTIITWGGIDPGSECNFPSTDGSSPSLWKKAPATAGNCKDTWVLSASWAVAKMSCGFTYNPTSKVWSQRVIIERGYQVPFNDSYKRSSLGRVESISFQVQISFPQTVVIDTQVSVVGSTLVSSNALLNVIYLPDLNKWRVDVVTYTPSPYKLALASSSVSSGFASRSPFSNISMDACTDGTVGCRQVVSTFLSGCDQLTGTLSIPLNFVCTAGVSESCLSTTEHATAVVNLNTQSSCNVTDTVEVQQQSLTSYDSDSLDNADISTSFELTDTAYFSANINSTDAVIVNKTVTNVCVVFSSSSNCVNVSFTLLSSSDPTKNPAFSVHLSQLSTSGSFSTAQTVNVKATVALSWLDAQQKRETVLRTDGISTPQTNIRVRAARAGAILDEELNNDRLPAATTNSNVWKMATIALVSVFGGACVAALIAAAVLLRRRTSNKTLQA